MSLARIIYGVKISLLLNLFYVSVVDGSTLIEQQEKVLLELANENVIESFHVLAAFYEKKANKKDVFTFQSIPWRIKAAQSGHVDSLYHLANYGLNFKEHKKLLANAYKGGNDAEKVWRNEGLVLISEAAILGDKHARMDLVLLPKMFNYTYKEIESAVNEAFVRLKKGVLLDCQFFVCQDFAADNTRILAQYNNAVFQFNQELSNLNCRKLAFCLELMIEKVRMVDKSTIDKFHAKYDYKNVSRLEKIKRLQKEASIVPSWEVESNIDRNKKRFLAAQEILDHHAVEDIKKFETKIRELLEKINYHRYADNKIQFSDVMEILSKP